MLADAGATKDNAQVNGTKRWAVDSLLILMFLVYRVALYLVNGVLYKETFSDETAHFSRVLAFVEMYNMNISPAILDQAYHGGIWPPLYPALIAAPLALFGPELIYARLINIALQVITIAFIVHSFESVRAKIFSAMIFSIFPGTATIAFRVMPENLGLMLLSALVYLISSRRLFHWGPLQSDFHGSAAAYFLVGLLIGLLVLTHGVFLLFGGYVFILLLTQVWRCSRWGVLACTAIVGPYIIFLNFVMHTSLIIVSTAVPSDIAYNNNFFLRNDYSNFEEARAQIREYVDNHVVDSKFEYYHRPFVLPESKYEDWNRWENKRRLYRELAIEYIVSDPLGYVERAYYRVSNIVTNTGCNIHYGCLIPFFDEVARPFIFACSLVVTLLLLWFERRVSWRSFRFSFGCLALVAPVILVLAVDRLLFPLVLLATFGLFHRGGTLPSEKAKSIPVR